MAMINSLNYGNDTHTFTLPYGVCSTAAGTVAKTVTVDNFSLETGATVIVKFTNANSIASPTLNVNGTGAKPIYRYGTTATSTGTTTTGWIAGAVQMFTYDGTGWIRDYWNNTTYSNASLGQGYVTCSTAAATTAKVGTLSSYSLTAGGIVSVKFTYDVPASSTLNINSNGAKSIYYRGAAITGDIIKAGDIATFIYSSQYHLISIDRWQQDINQIPVRGIDYWTEEDKAEIVRQVLASMAMPVAGIVDENNNIIITGELPDGAYTLRYEFADGSATNIGTLNISSGPAYTNLADHTSSDWLTNQRINSSKKIVDVTEAQRGDKTVVVTNKISASGVSKLHIKGLDIVSDLVNGSSTQNYGRVYAYKDGVIYLVTYQPSAGLTNYGGKRHYSYADYDSSVVILDLATLFADWGYSGVTEISFGGILTGAAEDVIITADEPIK